MTLEDVKKDIVKKYGVEEATIIMDSIKLVSSSKLEDFIIGLVSRHHRATSAIDNLRKTKRKELSEMRSQKKLLIEEIKQLKRRQSFINKDKINEINEGIEMLKELKRFLGKTA